ncbi:MAG TPA: MBL fold metallo-hydrolase [Saprospiraceae bacterium]|nr:MBL fold metallo-hydrolase [Saprospiraceae bacterium]
MKIKFCGAAQEVTGSCHLLILDNGYKILLDCGLFQGAVENIDELNSNWFFDPAEIDALILSHAHIDHCGRIPKLVKDGFRGNIICTHATRDLAAIMLLDTAHIQERDAEFQNKRLQKKRAKNPDLRNEKIKPLYQSHDVMNAMKLFISASYDRWIDVTKGVKVLFSDAGHILGSASVNLVINQGGDDMRIAFTGDIGRPNRLILRDPQPMLPADVVISESTYGDRYHLEKPAEKRRFLEIVSETCFQRKGKVIIPAFSLGRTQELVHMLDQLVNEGQLTNLPVFVDSPLAVSATDIFKAHPECFDEEMHEYILNDPDPFGFKRLSYITDVQESKRLNASKEPCIIISAAGMLNAGRIQHHVFNNIENPKNTILLVGYSTPSSPGGRLQRGADMIRLFGEELQVNAKIELMDSFSAHGDQGEMKDFISNQIKTCKKLFLVHGEYEVQQVYRDFLQQKGFISAEIPALDEEFSL